MRKKIYMFFIIIVISVSLSAHYVTAYDQTVADYNTVSNQPSESLQKGKVSKTVKKVVGFIPKILGGIKDIASNIRKNFAGTILTFLLDIIRFVADVFQMLANCIQTINLGTFWDFTLTYSADELYTDAEGGFEEGSGNRDMYTKIEINNSKSSKEQETPEGEAYEEEIEAETNEVEANEEETEAETNEVEANEEETEAEANEVEVNEDLPEETLPEETLPEETLPEETLLEETLPETLLGETLPGETLPDDTSEETSENQQKTEKEEEQYVIYIDGEKEGFTEETPIPVIPTDLYYMALGEMELLDINFFTIDEDIHQDENSFWVLFRNLANAFIHVTIYIAAAILIIMLIVQGISIVAHTYTNPAERAKHIEALQGFATSLLMLIGTVVIMAVSIYGSKAFLDDIKKENSYEGPIRVNVEEAGYSFSTTATGYFRYMAEIEDVDRYAEKAVYTFIYILLVIVNVVVMVFMFVRMVLMMVLAMVGPIVAITQALNIQSSNKYKAWVWLYVKLALIQVVMAIIYRIMLNCAI